MIRTIMIFLSRKPFQSTDPSIPFVSGSREKWAGGEHRAAGRGTKGNRAAGTEHKQASGAPPPKSPQKNPERLARSHAETKTQFAETIMHETRNPKSKTVSAVSTRVSSRTKA